MNLPMTFTIQTRLSKEARKLGSRTAQMQNFLVLQTLKLESNLHCIQMAALVWSLCLQAQDLQAVIKSEGTSFQSHVQFAQVCGLQVLLHSLAEFLLFVLVNDRI